MDEVVYRVKMTLDVPSAWAAILVTHLKNDWWEPGNGVEVSMAPAAGDTCDCPCSNCSGCLGA